MSNYKYDVIIIGAGPAGLSAGLYAARADLKTLIFEKKMIGGQMALTNEMENYPGTKLNTSTQELIGNMKKQCAEFGVEFKNEEIVNVELKDDLKVVHTKDNNYYAKSVIVATGNSPRKLNAKGEEKLTGKGVSYCALCDGRFFTDYEVFVVGGGNSAIEESLFLTKFVRKVTVFNRSKNLRASPQYIAKAHKNDKIEIVGNKQITEIMGENKIDAIKVKDLQTGEEQILGKGNEPYGLFVFIGRIPNTKMFENCLALSENGYVITDRNMKTSVSGVFAAGDVREKEVRQVVTAVSDGAIAAVEAEKYINNMDS